MSRTRAPPDMHIPPRISGSLDWLSGTAEVAQAEWVRSRSAMEIALHALGRPQGGEGSGQGVRADTKGTEV